MSEGGDMTDGQAAALVAVIEAVRAYAPPDGISAHEAMTRIMEAIDNPEICRVREGASDWMPIDTAPKDGTPIIGGYFDVPSFESERKGSVVRCWFKPEFDAFVSPEVEPVSHWIPMPPAQPKG